MFKGVRDRASEYLLMQLGELATDDDLAVAECFVNVGEGVYETVRSLEGDPCSQFLNEGLEHLASWPAASWEEAEVDELVGVDAGHAQGSSQG